MRTTLSVHTPGVTPSSTNRPSSSVNARGPVRRMNTSACPIAPRDCASNTRPRTVAFGVVAGCAVASLGPVDDYVAALDRVT